MEREVQRAVRGFDKVQREMKCFRAYGSILITGNDWRLGQGNQITKALSEFVIRFLHFSCHLKHAPHSSHSHPGHKR